MRQPVVGGAFMLSLPALTMLISVVLQAAAAIAALRLIRLTRISHKRG